MRLAGIGCNDGFLKRQEIFTGADDEPVVRKHDKIGSTAAREVESDRHSTRLGWVVGDEGVLRRVGEANGDGERASLEMSRLGKTRRVFGGRERSLAYNPFCMRSPIRGIVSGHLNHSLEDLLS